MCGVATILFVIWYRVGVGTSGFQWLPVKIFQHSPRDTTCTEKLGCRRVRGRCNCRQLHVSEKSFSLTSRTTPFDGTLSSNRISAAHR